MNYIVTTINRLRKNLLVKIIFAIVLGIFCARFFPLPLTRVFVTLNMLFGNFLGFAIPLIILGLVAPAIAELGNGAGKLLGITVLLAYSSTVIAGFFSYFTCDITYPLILDRSAGFSSINNISANSINTYMNLDMPPVMGVMTALIHAFVLGLGLASVKGDYLKNVLNEFREVVNKVISKVIIPLLPLYIFGIFLKISAEGQVSTILGLFFKVIIVICIMHIVWLILLFCIAGIISKKNPFTSLCRMLPAYATALGTQSSAATIPVTLKQTKMNGINADMADFVIPLCATIHLSGSTLKIVACAFAIMWMNGLSCGLDLFSGFIFILGVTMVAAPGVPGGAIMAALGILSSILGFDETLQGLMIALYITMDSFGTACNVTGDGAIAMIVDKLYRRKASQKSY